MTRSRLDLEVHRHGRRAGVPRRVHDRLARREQQRLEPVDRAVAHPHDLDGHTVLGLDRRRELFERGAERGRARVASATAPPPSSHARSSRSCMRASRTTSRGSSARRCTSASVCSTESCRCAATSARSSARMRSPPFAHEFVHERETSGPEHDDDSRRTPRTPPMSAPRKRATTSRRSRTNAITPARTKQPPAIARASAPRSVPDQHRERVGRVGWQPFEDRPRRQLGSFVVGPRSRANGK